MHVRQLLPANLKSCARLERWGAPTVLIYCLQPCKVAHALLPCCLCSFCALFPLSKVKSECGQAFHSAPAKNLMVFRRRFLQFSFISFSLDFIFFVYSPKNTVSLESEGIPQKQRNSSGFLPLKLKEESGKKVNWNLALLLFLPQWWYSKTQWYITIL